MPEYQAPLSGLVQGIIQGQQLYNQRHQQLVDDVLQKYQFQRQQQQDVLGQQQAEWERGYKERELNITEGYKKAMEQFHIDQLAEASRKNQATEELRDKSITLRGFTSEQRTHAQVMDFLLQNNFTNDPAVANAIAKGILSGNASSMPGGSPDTFTGPGSLNNGSRSLPAQKAALYGAQTEDVKSQTSLRGAQTKETNALASRAMAEIGKWREEMRNMRQQTDMKAYQAKETASYHASLVGIDHQRNRIEEAKTYISQQRLNLDRAKSEVEKDRIHADLNSKLTGDIQSASKIKQDAESKVAKLKSDLASAKALANMNPAAFQGSTNEKTAQLLEHHFVAVQMQAILPELIREQEHIRNSANDMLHEARANRAQTITLTGSTGRPDRKATAVHQAAAGRDARSAHRQATAPLRDQKTRVTPSSVRGMSTADLQRLLVK